MTERLSWIQPARAYVHRGDAKYVKGDFEGAIADADRAIELNPAVAEAYAVRGDAKRAKGDNEEAIADYDRAIELAPADAQAYARRVRAKLAKWWSNCFIQNPK